MRVALDVTARIAGMTGVARYAAELDEALARQGVDVRRYALGRAVFSVPAQTRHVPIPLRVLHAAWGRSELPRIEWLAPRADVVHTLDLVAPPTRRPSVATVHDLDALAYPDIHSRRAVAIQRAQVASLCRADIVLVVSHAVSRALVRAGVADSRIVVTPLGRTRLPSATPSRVPGAERYVLCVGQLGWRKGQDVLVRAMADPRLDSTALVLAGPAGFGGDEVRAEVARLGLAKRVVFEGAVDDSRLASLYSGAAAFAMPSRAEGFGLPALEAMAAGIPSVVSDAEALVDLVGPAAEVVPVGDHGALADALAAVLNDAGRATRLRAAGPDRAAAFTWDACATATIAAYERIVA